MRAVWSGWALSLVLGWSNAVQAEDCLFIRDAALRQVCLSDTLRPLHDAKADLEAGQPAERFAAWRTQRLALAGNEDALARHYLSHLGQLAQERLAQRPDWPGGMWRGQAGRVAVELLWLPPDPPRVGMENRFPAAFVLQLRTAGDAHATLLAGNAAGDREWRWRDCELQFALRAEGPVSEMQVQAYGRCDARGSGGRIRGPRSIPDTLVLSKDAP